MLSNNNLPSEIDILLIEDDLADANLLRFAFKQNQLSHKLHHVLDGIEGLDLLKQYLHFTLPLPNLILLDINMPRMNGREFLAVLKADEHLRQIPVIMLTTSSFDADIQSAYHLGAAGYITKPADLDQFIQAIHIFNQYWFCLVQLPKRML
ncbi:MAG: hypothetical protein RL637_1765 [Pseudomonadota bacterium]|jgi:CheY-like chemotaxis protein